MGIDQFIWSYCSACWLVARLNDVRGECCCNIAASAIAWSSLEFLLWKLCALIENKRTLSVCVYLCNIFSIHFFFRQCSPLNVTYELLPKTLYIFFSLLQFILILSKLALTLYPEHFTVSGLHFYIYLCSKCLRGLFVNCLAGLKMIFFCFSFTKVVTVVYCNGGLCLRCSVCSVFIYKSSFFLSYFICFSLNPYGNEMNTVFCVELKYIFFLSFR